MTRRPSLAEVAQAERETVRVFAIDLAPGDAKSWASDQSALEVALGAELDWAHIEHFPAKDLDGLGLTQFLIDGYGVAEAQIAADREALDAAGPYILLLRARAFKGAAVTLSPTSPLVPLGAYGQAQAAPSQPTAARETEPAGTATAPPEEHRPPPHGSLVLVLIFVGLAAILFAVLIMSKL